MLSSEELARMAHLKSLSPANCEKDYLQEAILFSLYKSVGRELVFKGGTCLYKFYGLTRFSEDLDFSARKGFGFDAGNAARETLFNLRFLGIEGRAETFAREREASVRLFVRGPLYKGARESLCFIPLHVSRRERVLLKPVMQEVRPLYKEIPRFEAFVMSEEEILAEKIRAICERRQPRDVYDAWFLLAKKGVGFNASLANKKLRLVKKKFDFKGFSRAVEAKRLGWSKDLRALVIGELPEFDAVKNEIAARIAAKLTEAA